MQFHGAKGRVERKNPLLPERVERPRCARRNYEDLAAVVEEAKLLNRKRICAELLLKDSNDLAQAAGRDSILREALDRADGNKVAEGIKMLAPSRPGTNQPQPFPIAKTPRIQA